VVFVGGGKLGNFPLTGSRGMERGRGGKGEGGYGQPETQGEKCQHNGTAEQ